MTTLLRCFHLEDGNFRFGSDIYWFDGTSAMAKSGQHSHQTIPSLSLNRNDC
jgi:hypothetical protein